MLDPRDFQNKIKEWHQKSEADVEADFANLTDYISELCPIKLLSQLNLTFLVVPEGEFREESDEIQTWFRWIEFLAGYLFSRSYPVDPERHIDGKNIEKIEKLLGDYFRSISSYLLTSVSSNDDYLEAKMLIASVRSYSLYVRGATYPHKFLELAQDVYSEHDQWFTRRFGFTIKQAIDISISIRDEYNERINVSKEYTKLAAKETVDRWIRAGEVQEVDRDETEPRLACYLRFGNSDKLISFTVDELSAFSGFGKDICQCYLNRLSQNFGYRNLEFPKTFSDPYSAPWDYNTLYEKPIIYWSDRYFVPLPSILPTVLFDTFHYDLLADSSYKVEYDRKRAFWLERRTADCLKDIFPSESVFLKPEYPNGDELSDVLVLYDRKVFVIQCKSKRMRRESRVGDNIETLRDDVKKGIRNAFDQALRARDYLKEENQAQIMVNGRDLVIDMDQVTDVFLLSVTLGDYQSLTTRLANIEPALSLFSDNQYPWALSLPDLEVLTEVLDHPAMFIHYAERRLQVEQVDPSITADEMDLLGFYLEQGLFLETDLFRKMDWISLTGLSSDIDKYMHDKYFLGGDCSKPKPKMPPGFEDYLTDIELLQSSCKTDCAIRLLDLSYQDKESFVKVTEQIKRKAKQDGGLHSFSTVVGSGKFGISFIAMDARGDKDRLFKQTLFFATLKKHQVKCKEWVSFGWEKNSRRKLDVAVFLSYESVDDPVLDGMVEECVRRGDFIEEM